MVNAPSLIARTAVSVDVKQSNIELDTVRVTDQGRPGATYAAD